MSTEDTNTEAWKMYDLARAKMAAELQTERDKCEKLRAERDDALRYKKYWNEWVSLHSGDVQKLLERAAQADIIEAERDKLTEELRLSKLNAGNWHKQFMVAMKERDELAAQNGKIKGALNTWKLAEKHALSYGHLEDADCADVYEQAIKDRDEALALPDLSTGILNSVRAEALMKAADMETGKC